MESRKGESPVKCNVQQVQKRKTVADTDVGKELKESIRELEELLNAYREGLIVEAAV